MARFRLSLPSRERLVAIARQRCPNCLQGPVFKRGITMNDGCSVCGHEFMREQGYFQGAMYMSYALGIPLMLFMTVALMLVLPSHSPTVALFISVPIFLLLVPVMFRYSRVLWMHLFYHAF